jgi:hypothetical protein
VTGTPAPTKTLDIFSLVDALSNGSMLGLGDSGKIFKIQKQNRERERERGEFWIVFMTHTYMNHTHSCVNSITMTFFSPQVPIIRISVVVVVTS